MRSCEGGKPPVTPGLARLSVWLGGFRFPWTIDVVPRMCAMWRASDVQDRRGKERV